MSGHRICHISTVHTTFDQRIFHRECWSTHRAGYDTHLVIEANKDSIVDGVHIHAVDVAPEYKTGMHIGRRLKRLWNANKLAKKLRPDIVHLHDPELILLGLWLKLTTRYRVIFDCHENNVAYIKQKAHLSNTLSRFVLIPLMAFAERLAARRFDAVVTADRGVTEIFEEEYHGRRTALVHNYPRLDLFLDQGNVTAADENKWPEVDLVYHGTIPKYHLEVAFEIAEILQKRDRRVTWLFFGKAGVRQDWIESELEKRGLADCFNVDPKRIPHQDVARRVKRARIGFIPLPDLPKFQYNIPTKLFEFMALGMPTILSDLPPSRPFVGDGKAAIMVRADDYEGYADAIEKLLDDEPLRTRMGKHGKQQVIEEFNWEVESAHLTELYETLLAE